MTPDPDKGKETVQPEGGQTNREEQQRGVAGQKKQEEVHYPTSLNEELAERLRKNPNHFIGCG